MGNSFLIAIRSSTERNNKIRSCTWAKRSYLWRLLSSCRAPLTLPPHPQNLPVFYSTTQMYVSGGMQMQGRAAGDTWHTVHSAQHTEKRAGIWLHHPNVCPGVKSAATLPGVGGGTHRRRATFEQCWVFVGGVPLGVRGVVLVVCVYVCRCRGCCSVCVCVCDLLICLPKCTSRCQVQGEGRGRGPGGPRRDSLYRRGGGTPSRYGDMAQPGNTYIYIYIFIYLFIYIYIYTHVIYAYIHMCVYIFTWIYTWRTALRFSLSWGRRDSQPVRRHGAAR